MTDNAAVASVFNELADLTDIRGGDPYRARAFRRVARIIENLREPVGSMIRFHRLQGIPGIGEGTVHRIKQILRSGTCSDYTDLTRAMPAGLRDLIRVPGIGPKTVRYLYQHERIASVEELEVAARSGRLPKLPGFGEDARERILASIARFRRKVGRLLLPEAVALGHAMRDALRADPSVVHAELTGSARRRKESLGDLDILVASHDPAPCVARFVSLPQIAEILVRGDSKCSAIVAGGGQQVDLRVIPPESFGAGMHYFTGSQQHNIALRARGNRRALKISEHGVFRRADERLINPCPGEAEIFAAVGLPYIPPELRENTGELEAAAKGRLPHLVEESAIKGDLHVHSRASVGSQGTPQEIAAAAALLGLEYVAITDHARDVAEGFDDLVPRLRRAGHTRGVDILAGLEVEIGPDGTLLADPRTLERADFVVATVQNALDMPRKEMTERFLRAMETGVVDLIGHPTGRLIDQREPSDLDMEKFLKAARRLEVAVELNAHPRRIDLDSSSCRYAGELGVPVAISAGADAPAELARRTLGVWTARRGWLEAKDVLNTRSLEEIRERRRHRLRKGGLVVQGAVKRSRKRASVAKAVAARPRLEESLSQRPLPPWLIERLEAYLHTPDEELESALKRLPGARPPAQKAFDLLFG